ncbi:MAG: class I SAM-dependent methyltransferase [Phycisphaerae bacterium]
MKKYYDTRYSFDPRRAAIWRAITERVQRYVRSQGTLLELGCGYADFINQIKAGEKIAVDIDPKAAGYCSPGVRFIQGPVDQLGAIADASVDTVFASNLFEHLTCEQLDRTLAELRRVTRPQARILLLQPNYRYAYREYFDDYTHTKVFSHISLADFLTVNGFTPHTVIPRFLPLTMKSLLPKSYLLTKFYFWIPFGPLGKQMLVVAQKE